MEKKARLILAQIDHLSGETLGSAIEDLLKLGANNVQLLPSVTKKSRPGMILWIDLNAGLETVIADYLTGELKISGYHRVDTTHVFQDVSYVDRNLTVISGDKRESFVVKVKMIGNRHNPISMDVEHDFIVDLQNSLESRLGVHMSLLDLKSAIESRLGDSGETIELEI